VIQADTLLTTADAAEILDVNESRVRQLCIAGDIKGKKPGKQRGIWLIPEVEVLRYRDSKRKNHKM